MAETKLPLIEVGYQVFTKDGAEEFGAVRDVVPGGRPEIVVYIENSHEFTIPLSAITAVHSEKVLVDLAQLPGDIQDAVKHAHDGESY